MLAVDRSWLRTVAWRAEIRGGLLWAACLAMAVVALERLHVAFSLLVTGSDPRAAVDLLDRWQETRRWFAGLPYSSLPMNMAYPPETYAVLWPVMGLLPQPAVRWLWAALLLAAAAWLIALLFRASGAQTAGEAAFWALLVLSSQATSFLVATGQFTLLILPVLIAAVLRAYRRPRLVRNDLAVAALGVLALVKPTVAAPFCWTFLFCAPTPLPGVLVVAAYAVLTLVAAAFQPLSLAQLARVYLESTRGFDAGWGYGNLHSVFAFHGLHQWVIPAGLTALALLGIWVYRNRRSDPWFVLSVTALVARFWTYHQVYDDILVLVPLAFLVRWLRERRGSRGARIAVSALVAAASLVLVAPGRFLLFPDSAEGVLQAVRTSAWLAVLAAVLVVPRAPAPRAEAVREAA